MSIKRKIFDKFSNIFECFKGSKQPALLVLDIDNTILKTPEDFGSDQWFDWQLSILGKKEEKSVAIDFIHLLSIYNKIHENLDMELCEQDTSLYINNFKKKRFDIILLTARNNETYNNIKRNLEKYDIWNKLTTHLENEKFKYKHESQISEYKNGIIMSGGMNKGLLLNNYLNLSKIKYETVIFVDDKELNINNIIFHNPSINTVLYTNQHENINNFKKRNN